MKKVRRNAPVIVVQRNDWFGALWSVGKKRVVGGREAALLPFSLIFLARRRRLRRRSVRRASVALVRLWPTVVLLALSLLSRRPAVVCAICESVYVIFLCVYACVIPLWLGFQIMVFMVNTFIYDYYNIRIRNDILLCLSKFPLIPSMPRRTDHWIKIHSLNMGFSITSKKSHLYRCCTSH